MSMISDQINKLREAVKSYRPYVPYYVIGLLHNAADTIESLSAKLQAKEYCDGCPGADIKEIPCTEECKRRHFKAENMQRSAEDCGGGWIYCGDGNNLPEPGRRYRVTALWKDGDFETRSVYDLVYGTDGLWHGENYTPVSFEIIAWKPLEEPYRENIEERVRKSILGVAQMSDKAWAAYRKEQRTLRRSKRR